MPITTMVAPGPPPTTIDYDPVRDRMLLSGPNGSVPYGYTSGAHRMLTAGPRTLQWDPPVGCTQTAAPGRSTLFVYAADGALKEIVQNGQAFKFQVDALGRLAREVLPSGAQRLVAADDADGGLARVEYLAAPGSPPVDSFVFGFAVGPVFELGSPPAPANEWATLTDPAGSITLRADGAGNVVQARAFGAFGEVLAQSNAQHVAEGFLGMEAVAGLSDLSLLGFAAGAAGSEHDPFAMGVPALRPYSMETGSFLYDSSFGPDGLFAAFQEQGDGYGPGRPYPRDFIGPLPPGCRYEGCPPGGWPTYPWRLPPAAGEPDGGGPVYAPGTGPIIYPGPVGPTELNPDPEFYPGWEEDRAFQSHVQIASVNVLALIFIVLLLL